MIPTDDDPTACLERMYDNRARVPEHPAFFERWASDSARARASQPCQLDVPYGTGLKETLDVFPAATPGPAPVLVFIHGGYWRALDKSQHSFLAPALTRSEVCVVMPNYALCPGTEEAPVTIPGIALQTARALAWTWRHIGQHGGDPRRITVAGHSAGGHLAAMLLACQWPRLAADLPRGLVRNALSISGMYDLAPIRATPSLQASLRLTPADVQRVSPARWPAPAAGPLFSVAGSDESEEYHRHNALIREKWGDRVVPVCELLPARNHFSVLDDLADPGTRLHALALELLRA